MEFKLAYKTYSYGWSLSNFKRFYDATKLDLPTVLQEYIICYSELQGESQMARHVAMSKLYSRDVAAKLFHSIVDKDLNIPLDEFDDATFRTSWLQLESVDGFSEEYPMILLSIAMAFNDYVQSNIHVKKKLT